MPLWEKRSSIVRIGFPLSAILISGGLFGAAAGKHIEKLTKLIGIFYMGAVILFFLLLILGVGLINSH